MSGTKSTGILFSGHMIRAYQRGQKTQTRRPVKPQPKYPRLGYMTVEGGAIQCGEDYPDGDDDFVRCPWGKTGDRLWFRETWAPMQRNRPIPNPEIYDDVPAWYEADGNRPMWAGSKWKPSIHMPRWACRYEPTITDIRVQRVQDITRLDCYYEGWPHGDKDTTAIEMARAGLSDELIDVAAIEWYAKLWDSLYGKGAWERNDWVWRIEFTGPRT